MNFSTEKLKDLLVGGDFLDDKEFARAKVVSENREMPLPAAVVELGLLSDSQMGSLLAAELGLPFVDLQREQVNVAALLLLPERVATAQQAVVYKRTPEYAWVAVSEPDNYEFISLLRKRFATPLKVGYATPSAISETLKIYQKDLIQQSRKLVESMSKTPRDEDTVKLVDLLMHSALKERASDIHIEPEEKNIVVRFRIDGSLREILRYPSALHEKVVFRIKILARMRTDEHAQAQDGRFEIFTSKYKLNLRVSILPITYGENVVMRLLSEQFQRLRLEDLGLLEDDLKKVRHAADLPYGMILAVGPTGSGKTTTLYAILHLLNQSDVNITTIEDPVEYDVQGIRQIQVNSRSNLNYEAGLKSIVRQDPDIIMVGEIRDTETASLAVNAALTGHLLLSTLHANDAATAFPRLAEMKLEPFLTASSINVVIAQRLVRRICMHCIATCPLSKETREIIERDPELRKLLLAATGEKNLSKVRLYCGKGCDVCGHTGYAGRLGIFEIMEISEELRPLIVSKATSAEIRAKAIELGMRTMLDDGLLKVTKGSTTLDEVLRAIHA